MRVLYLGAAHGTTVSHVADYVEVVYAVENAYTPMRDLLAVALRRKNIIPLFADAAGPASYAPLVEEVEHPFPGRRASRPGRHSTENAPFIRRGGTALIVVKARSIDVTEKPADIVREFSQEMESCGMPARRVIWLEPYHRDHAILECPRD